MKGGGPAGMTMSSSESFSWLNGGEDGAFTCVSDNILCLFSSYGSGVRAFVSCASTYVVPYSLVPAGEHHMD